MHQEVLTNTAKQLLPYFKQLKSFYLAGGTALALQIGHRVSFDFDFFSDNRISKSLSSLVKKSLLKNISIKISVNNSEELTLFAKDTKVTFLYYPFPLIKPLLNLHGLKVPTVSELAAMKAYTIGRRGEYKDYIDLYCLLSENHVSLQKILEIAKKKYKDNFNDRLFLEQLIYLDDINIADIKLIKQTRLTKTQIKKFFEQQVKSLNLTHT